MKNEYSQLLIDVQKKSKITVTNSRDLKFLKEDIETNTKTIIGYNTVRRLFGYLEEKKPSNKTLNTLALYLGFSSYTKYKNNFINYDEWYFQQNLLRMQNLKELSNSEIELINNGLTNGQNIIYLAYFLSYQLQNNNLKLVETIFKSLKLRSIANTEMHKFSMILTSNLTNIPEKKALTIYKTLIPINAFRNNVPLLYIDYANLNKRYGKILNLIANNGANASDLHYTALMNVFNKFYTEDPTLNFNVTKPNEFESLYITLQGRYYGYEIFKSNLLSSELKKEIIQKCKKSNIGSFAVEIIPALIIKEEFAFLEKLFTLFYEELLEDEVWSSKTTNALYLIGLANVNWNNKNLKAAKSNLDLIQLKKIELSYEVYVKLFYFLTELKITFTEKEKAANKLAHATLKKLVKITGFKKFLSEGSKYVIK